MCVYCFPGFNTLKEEYPDASRIPHTDSDSDLASASPDGSTSATRLLDVFRSRFAPTLWTVSVRQGGGHSGSADKTAVPQESTHNGQEKAGGVIFDLAHTATHSLTDSMLSFTENDSDLSSAETQPAGVSESARTTVTRSRSNTDANTLPEKVPLTTKIHSDTHSPLVCSDAPVPHDSKGGDITVMSSAPLASGPCLTARASVTDRETSKSHRFQDVTDRDEPFRTKSPNHMNQNNPDLSVTDKTNSLSDSDLEVSEFNSVAYMSDGAVRSSAYTDTAETEASRTNHVPHLTHINNNVSNHTHSPLFNESDSMTDVPAASVSHRQIETATLSGSHTDAVEKSTEYYSNTAYNTNSLNPNSTPANSATTPPSHTVRREHATLHQQMTYQWTGGANTQRTSSDPPPAHTELPSSPVTPTRQDFTSTSGSYSAYTPGQGDPNTSATLHTSSLMSVITTHRYDPTTTLRGLITGTKSIPEVQTQNDTNDIIARSGSNNPSHVKGLSTEFRPTTSALLTLSTSSDFSMTPTTLNPAGTLPSHLTTPSTHTLVTASTRATPVNLHTSHTTRLIKTTRWNETRTENLLTTSRNTAIAHQPDITATTREEHTLTHSQPGTHTPLTTQTSTRRMVTARNHKDWSQKGQVFIMEDQPAIINGI